MSIKAWETAMGMRGYAGSPAQLEDMKELQAITSWRTVPLDNPLVEKHLALSESIMLHKDDRLFRGTHYKARRDQGGWYIRQGKRGTLKSYLNKCQITSIKGEPTLFQFYLRK